MKIKLLSAADYVTHATAAIQSAKQRVYVIALVIADHSATHNFMTALVEAAERGVTVVVAADVFTFGEVNGSFLPLRYYSKGSRQSTSMVKTLKTAGASFHWLGHGRMTLINGRTHSKWCVVDDTSFVFGGVNLYEEGIKNVDYMFQADDARLADRLVHEQTRILQAERLATNYSSRTFHIDDHAVLFDGGIIGHSLIYRRAIELTKQASHVTFVSQYCPTGKLAKALKNVPHQLYFNRPQQATLFNRWLIQLNMFLTGFETAYANTRYLHAKCMLFTMPDGSKILITGSHNFAYAGVLFGTREIALETKDPTIIHQLESFLTQQVL